MTSGARDSRAPSWSTIALGAPFAAAIAIYTMSDYQSTIVELRRLREILPSVWTLRLPGGIPFADALLLFGTALLVLPFLSRTRPRRSALDMVVLCGATIVVLWSALGWATRQEQDLISDALYQARVFAGLFACFAGGRVLLESGVRPRQLLDGLLVLAAACLVFSTAKVVFYTSVLHLSVYAASDGSAFWMSDAEHSNVFTILAVVVGARIAAGGISRVRWWEIASALGALVVMILSTRRGNLIVVGVAATLALVRFAPRARLRQMALAVFLAAPLLVVGPLSRQMGSLIGRASSVLDTSNASSAGYFIGTRNVALNLARQDRFLLGFGLGRRYEEIEEIPILGASDLAWNLQNQSYWKLTLFTFPYGQLPLYFGLVGTSALLLLAAFAWRRIRAGLRAAAAAGAPDIFALALLELFLLSGTSLVRTMALNGLLLAVLSGLLDEAQRRSTVQTVVA